MSSQSLIIRISGVLSDISFIAVVQTPVDDVLRYAIRKIVDKKYPKLKEKLVIMKEDLIKADPKETAQMIIDATSYYEKVKEITEIIQNRDTTIGEIEKEITSKLSEPC